MATGFSTPMLQPNTPKRGASNRARHDYEGRCGVTPASTQSLGLIHHRAGNGTLGDKDTGGQVKAVMASPKVAE